MIRDGADLPAGDPVPAIFPAIDLRGGRCVRLIRGDRSAQIDYDPDPLAPARRWVEAGARWLHAIDLGAALGEADSLDALLAIARSVRVPVQAGGGLRSEEPIARLLEGGVRRVILGTRALDDPAFLEAQVRRWGPDRIVLAMDVRDGRVKVRGWEGDSSLDLSGGIAVARAAGAVHLLVTAIDRDGTLAGPDLDLLGRALAGVEAGSGPGGGVVAAGGIGSIEHIRSVLDLRHPRLEGVVVGRAIYEGGVDLRSAVTLSKEYRR